MAEELRRFVDAQRTDYAQALAELTDRQLVDTPIGEVCMSQAEHEAYLEERELRDLTAQETTEGL